jgi:hypothetical protein
LNDDKRHGFPLDRAPRKAGVVEKVSPTPPEFEKKILLKHITLVPKPKYQIMFAKTIETEK